MKKILKQIREKKKYVTCHLSPVNSANSHSHKPSSAILPTMHSRLIFQDKQVCHWEPAYLPTNSKHLNPVNSLNLPCSSTRSLQSTRFRKTFEPGFLGGILQLCNWASLSSLQTQYSRGCSTNTSVNTSVKLPWGSLVKYFMNFVLLLVARSHMSQYCTVLYCFIIYSTVL